MLKASRSLLPFVTLAASASLLSLSPLEAAPPGNDHQAGAQLLPTTLQWEVTGTTVEATSEPGERAHAGDPADQSVWFRWQPTDEQPVALQVTGMGDFQPRLAVYREGESGGVFDAESAPPVVALAIDRSTSTRYSFLGGGGVGDVNGDGNTNRVLDAHLAGAIEVLAPLTSKGYGTSAELGVISFNREAVTLDVNPSVAGVQPVTVPSADFDHDGMADVEAAIRSIRIEDSGTNYEAALQEAIAFFLASGSTGPRHLFFFSDGQPSAGGDFSDEVARLGQMGVKIHAFGAGERARLEALQAVDREATIFYYAQELRAVLDGATSAASSLVGQETRLIFLPEAGTNYLVAIDKAGPVAGAFTLSSEPVAGVSIGALPPEVKVREGETLRILAPISGVGELEIGWFFGTREFPIAATPTLTFDPAYYAHQGYYHLQVSNKFGFARSEPVFVRVLVDLPVLTSQPAGVRALEGASVTLAVSAEGTGPISYQWFHQGEALSGMTARTLVIPSVTPEDAGDYRVGVENPGGVVSSSAVQVEVDGGLADEWNYRVTPLPGRDTPSTFLTAAGERFFFLNGSQVVTSTDGLDWKMVVPPVAFDQNYFTQIRYSGGRYLMSRGTKTRFTAPRQVLLASDDGLTWEEVAPGKTIFQVAPTSGGWIGIGQTPKTTLFTSADGLGWEETALPPELPSPHILLSVGGGCLALDETNSAAWTPDGLSWVPVDIPGIPGMGAFTNPEASFSGAGKLFFYVSSGGDHGAGVVAWTEDGTTWDSGSFKVPAGEVLGIHFIGPPIWDGEKFILGKFASEDGMDWKVGEVDYSRFLGGRPGGLFHQAIFVGGARASLGVPYVYYRGVEGEEPVPIGSEIPGVNPSDFRLTGGSAMVTMGALVATWDKLVTRDGVEWWGSPAGGWYVEHQGTYIAFSGNSTFSDNRNWTYRTQSLNSDAIVTAEQLFLEEVDGKADHPAGTVSARGKLYLATTSGKVLVSEDLGDSWEELARLGSRLDGLAAAGDTIFAYDYTDGRWASSDGGLSWTQFELPVRLQDDLDRDAILFHDDHFFAFRTHNGTDTGSVTERLYYKSVDGIVWEERSMGLFENGYAERGRILDAVVVGGGIVASAGRQLAFSDDPAGEGTWRVWPSPGIEVEQLAELNGSLLASGRNDGYYQLGRPFLTEPLEFSLTSDLEDGAAVLGQRITIEAHGLGDVESLKHLAFYVDGKEVREDARSNTFEVMFRSAGQHGVALRVVDETGREGVASLPIIVAPVQAERIFDSEDAKTTIRQVASDGRVLRAIVDIPGADGVLLKTDDGVRWEEEDLGGRVGRLFAGRSDWLADVHDGATGFWMMTEGDGKWTAAPGPPSPSPTKWLRPLGDGWIFAALDGLYHAPSAASEFSKVLPLQLQASGNPLTFYTSEGFAAASVVGGLDAQNGIYTTLDGVTWFGPFKWQGWAFSGVFTHGDELGLVFGKDVPNFVRTSLDGMTWSDSRKSFSTFDQVGPFLIQHTRPASGDRQSLVQPEGEDSWFDIDWESSVHFGGSFVYHEYDGIYLRRLHDLSPRRPVVDGVLSLGSRLTVTVPVENLGYLQFDSGVEVTGRLVGEADPGTTSELFSLTPTLEIASGDTVDFVWTGMLPEDLEPGRYVLEVSVEELASESYHGNNVAVSAPLELARVIVGVEGGSGGVVRAEGLTAPVTLDVARGTRIGLEANAAPEHLFRGFELNGTMVPGSGGIWEIFADGDLAVVPVFVPLVEPVVRRSGMGTVTIDATGRVPADIPVAVTAEAADGWAFAGWLQAEATTEKVAHFTFAPGRPDPVAVFVPESRFPEWAAARGLTGTEADHLLHYLADPGGETTVRLEPWHQAGTYRVRAILASGASDVDVGLQGSEDLTEWTLIDVKPQLIRETDGAAELEWELPPLAGGAPFVRLRAELRE
ncbi:hypothetical protein BH23VER1_BH23VER1_16280 [soil metagenome]